MNSLPPALMLAVTHHRRQLSADATHVVVVSWPPGANPLAIHPSNNTGCISARAK